MTTRRLFTLLLAACGLMLAAPQPQAQPAPEKLTLLLDWFVNPNHAPIIVARERGLFKKHGLDVTIIEPSDPSAPPRLIAAGQGDIAVSYQPSYTRAIKSGIPVIRVGTLISTPLNTLTVLADGPVKTLADLKGRTIGYSGSGIQDMMLKQMLASVGLKQEDVKLVNVNFALTVGLVSGRVDAIIGGYRNFEAKKLSSRAKNPKCFSPKNTVCPLMTS